MSMHPRALAHAYATPMLDFARRLIQTPSLPGREGAVADLLEQEMQALGYDRVWRDEAGNVIGLMRGGSGKSLLFNCHMDHVDVGDERRWAIPPFEAVIRDGYLWGRGASDIKGPLAVYVYGVAAAKAAGLPIPGDTYVAGVVMEEVGGLGTCALLATLAPDWAIIGEATKNAIARGHRGRVEMVVTVRGRPSHASAPWRGINPHYALARFLTRLESLPMAGDPVLGSSSVAPTLIVSDQTSANVIPGEVRLSLDWRTIPGEGIGDILAKLSPILSESIGMGPTGDVGVSEQLLTAYTGYTARMPVIHPPYLLSDAHPLVIGARDALAHALERPIDITTWDFATDGGHLMARGVPTIGFSPGDESVVHTTEERISLALMEEALAGTIALATQMPRGSTDR